MLVGFFDATAEAANIVAGAMANDTAGPSVGVVLYTGSQSSWASTEMARRMNVRDLPLSNYLLDGRESILSLSSGLQVTSSHAAVLLRYTGPQRQSMSLSSHPFPGD